MTCQSVTVTYRSILCFVLLWWFLWKLQSFIFDSSVNSFPPFSSKLMHLLKWFLVCESTTVSYKSNCCFITPFWFLWKCCSLRFENFWKITTELQFQYTYVGAWGMWARPLKVFNYIISPHYPASMHLLHAVVFGSCPRWCQAFPIPDLQLHLYIYCSLFLLTDLTFWYLKVLT